MSISSVQGAGRVSLQNADPPAASTANTTANASSNATTIATLIVTPATPTSGAPDAAASDATDKPPPLRFPWLSRLSAQLEPVARQKSPFTAAPMLGDHLDRAA